jgi:hypothetical protein
MSIAILSVVLLSTAVGASAQSTNQSSPTSLTGNEYTGKGPSKETNYFFSFTGGPGEVTVGLEIKARDYSTFARLEVWSGNNTIATHNMNAATTTGASSVVKEFNLDEKQTILIKLTLDGNLANYKITLGGTVEGATGSVEMPPADTGGTTNGNMSNSTDPGPTASTSTTPGKIFNIDLGKFKLGQFINFPKTGTLVIQMKDGTTQEIDLGGVKSVTVKK